MPMLPDASENGVNKLIIDTSLATPLMSTEFENSDSLLNLQVDGTATAFTVTIESKLDSTAAYQPLAAFNLKDIAKTTNGQMVANGVYQTTIAGLPYIRITASGVIGGNIKVWMTK